ncbi:tricarboxylate transporter [Malaciobacter molluscorum LMG 25693]|uniref:Tricarboxylate transporter n=1 Tax=Malaciobacter molluscorum LMG 25693 TaxID=870501 RepID=A0A2G1DLN6_9BACT|nr:tripartite tricarboxylate transporter permease [Malaciobacter molluscorum]AXX92161.1 tripartite tricarboxylate transport protein TctABC, fused membrane-spanning/permease subunits TctA/TctB [Malaciobacter molluscorum LMG 25693]PHO19390.1 tricarboxylate transporter [Malaciobacter molluscorum LMG 25693]
MAFDTLMNAFTELMQIHHMLYLFGGVMLGIIVGILPGLGGIVGFSIMLPFLYGMDTTSALAMLIGMVAVVPTSDTFTSVLMGIPGSSASQATVLDGYPLSQKGEAARALGAAFTASLIGGLLGAIILSAFIVFARELILKLGSAELFILGIFGLSMVGVLSGKSLYKGFIAAAIGLLLGSIGSAPATGEFRMTFGSFYLYDGIKLVILGLGVYAVPEIISLLIENKKISKAEKLKGSFVQGIKDVWFYKWIVARCAPIGAMIGAIPGLGGSVVDWIAYGHVVQTSKDKSKFGKGDIRGVIAPESANNAKEGGGLIPTLLFGIPGSGSMAVFLGGLIILGIQPGPGMVKENLEVSYIIIWSLAIANIVGTVTCMLLSNKISKITTIPYGYVAPFMLMIIFFAALQATRSLEDLILLIAIGALGTLFKYFDWPRPALLIGFVLAGTIETYYYQAVQFYSWEMLERPGVIILILFMLTSILLSVYFKKRDEKKSKENQPRKTEEHKIKYSFFSGELIFIWSLMAFALFALIDSFTLRFLGGIFPIIVSSLLLIFGIILSIQITSKKRQKDILAVEIIENGQLSSTWVKTWTNFLILPIFLLGTWILGFIPALAILFILIIRIKMNSSWLKIIIITSCAIAFLLFISNAMVLHLPTGLIYDIYLKGN